MPVKLGRLDKTEAAFTRQYDAPVEDRRMQVKPLFDASKAPASAFHFVFCLDG